MKDIIYLDGLWELCLDEKKEGIEKQFYRSSYNDSIVLPSTLSVSEKGQKNSVYESEKLTESYKFEGYAWYQRTVILRDVSCECAKLFLERTRSTMLWVNGSQVGDVIRSVNTPHVYDISGFLKKGENVITVMVDNTSDAGTQQDQQTNWNGITGEISIRTYRSRSIENIRMFPDVRNNTVKTKLKIRGIQVLELNVVILTDGFFHSHRQFEVRADENGDAEFVYPMGECRLWNEHDPTIYTMSIELVNGEKEDISFGMREFEADGKKLKLNGNEIFLRGKQERLVFPMTGTAPTSIKEWLDIFGKMRLYGLNHCYFCGSCPPDAAFTAADMLGICIETELSGKNLSENEFLNEGFEIINAFGNHPSFCMLHLAGECGKNAGVYTEYDNRIIYASDDMTESSFWCSPEPEKVIEKYSQKPVIRQGTGRYSFYPDLDEAGRYTGALKAENLEILKARLIKQGMLEKWKRFYRAAGHFAVDCYKNEIETAMLSEKLAGFQLFDIQDIPGEFVGILNSFGESKNFITPEKWRGFCSDKVLLAKFDSNVITEKVFIADIFMRSDVTAENTDDYIHWEISSDENVLDGGDITISEKKRGLSAIGNIHWNVPEFSSPKKITLTINAKGTENSYDLWIFPEADTPDIPNMLSVTQDVSEALNLLDSGKSVVLVCDKLKNGVKSAYCEDFHRRTFGSETADGTLGLLVDNFHPSLSLMSSDYYSTPQWRNIVESGVCAILDDAPDGYYPIIQIIDNWDCCRRLGNMFEANVSNGRLMVCTMSAEKLMKTAEGKWFLKSIYRYCSSEDFRPQKSLDKDYIRELFM